MTNKGKFILRIAGCYLAGSIGAAVFRGEWPPVAAYVAFVVFVATVSLALDIIDHVMRKRGY